MPPAGESVMRIGLVTACYTPVINGVTRMVQLYRRQLEARGHDVTVFTWGEAQPDDDAGVLRAPAWPLGQTGYYVGLRLPKALQQSLREQAILHCHHPVMALEIAHRYATGPVVFTNHTRYDLYAEVYAHLPAPLARLTLRRLWPRLTDNSDVVIAPSLSVRAVLQQFGVQRPIEVIENGVDLGPFTCPPAPLRKGDWGLPAEAVLMIYVGRLAQEKRMLTLLRCFAAARARAPQLHWLVVGDGPQRATLQAAAQAAGVAQAIHWVGALPPQAVANHLAAADFFATASISEVHPLTVIEALAAGRPVVGMRSPGLSDIVTAGQDGWLAERGEDDLTDGLVALATQSEQRQRLSQAARRAGQRYSIDRTLEQTLALYERLRRERPDLRRAQPHGGQGTRLGRSPHLFPTE